MKAITLNQHGDLSKITVGEMPVPVPARGEVLLHLKAAALNRLDLWLVEGWRGLNLTFPHIMGCDGSGVVCELGTGVTEFDIGDRVAINPTRSCGRCDFCLAGRDNMCDHFAIFGEHIPGFFAEYQALPTRNLLPLPDDISHEIAAAGSLIYVTAWHSLVEVGRLRAGQTVLVVGAAGGVNTASIDIARLAGAGKIFVVGSNEKKLDLARQLGADVTINRQETDWASAVYQITGGEGVDIVVDNVGAATFHSSLRSLKKGGRLLTVGNTSGPVMEIDNRYIFGKHLRIIGSTMGPIATYREVMSLIFAGRLKPVIDTVYPIEQGVEALRRMAAYDTLGKLVLEI
jgi:NADPH:quinone reductase-like Zn-dependent oxidoreductase